MASMVAIRSGDIELCSYLERNLIPNSIKLIAGRTGSLINEKVVKEHFGIIMRQQSKTGTIFLSILYPQYGESGNC